MVTHLNASERVQKRNVVWKWRSHCEWDQVGEIGRNAGVCCAQKDAFETDQTSNDIWGRNVGYNETKKMGLM